MTTIACNRETMAADSQVADGNGLRTRARKLHRVNDLLVGYAGSMPGGVLFVEWARGGFDPDGKPDLSGFGEDVDFEALTLDEEGLWHWSEQLVKTPVLEAFYAIGTGGAVALGAMEVGATPRDAVEAACRWDVNSGPPVASEKLYASEA